MHRNDMFQQSTIGSPSEDTTNDNESQWTQSSIKARDDLNAFLCTKHLEAEQLTATKSWHHGNCLLRSLMENDGELVLSNYTLSDRVDSMMSMAFGSCDATAASLTNLVYSMWRHPEETGRVRADIDEHPNLSNANSVYTSSSEMECFIDESMRFDAMLAHNALRIGPVQTDKADKDLLEFRPSRFKVKGVKANPCSYMHFEPGLHKFVGEYLTMLQMRNFMSMLLRDYDFQLDEKMLSEMGTVNHLNLKDYPFYNVYLKLNQRREM